jgi:hypothetical protein
VVTLDVAPEAVANFAAQADDVGKALEVGAVKCALPLVVTLMILIAVIVVVGVDAGVLGVLGIGWW